jgi:rhamnulokinase
VHRVVPFHELYRRNGLQFLPFNTVYQLAAERDAANGCLDLADAMLLVPDLIGFQLTGSKLSERTNASTTGLLGVASGEWDDELIEQLGLPASVFAPPVGQGESIGGLRPGVAADLGAPAGIEVVAVGSHDTASAVVAIPMRAESAAYISCGTWGLVGVELEHPVTTDAAREANFTNEGGVDGRVRFLHNVMGLWLLSETLRQYERDGHAVDLASLLDQAAAAPAPAAVFDTDDPRFLPPGDMPARIEAWYRERGLAPPGGRAEMVRAIVESLAAAFAANVSAAAELSGKNITTVHIVGGGSQNRLLCQLTADRLGLPLLAGPVEATALGNVLLTARAHDLITGDLESLRGLVAAMFPPQRYTPRSSHIAAARSVVTG